MLRRFLSTLLPAYAAAGLAAAAAFGGATAVAANDACTLISQPQLGSILGLSHVQILKDIPGHSSPDDPHGDIHAACVGVAWTGAPPTTQQAARQALENGTGAAFAIETWAPDKTSTHGENWKSKGLDTLTGTNLILAEALPGSPVFEPHHFHTLSPKEGTAIGATGTPLNLVTVRGVAGTWWNESSFMIATVLFEESASKPYVKHLNQIAAIAVAKFGLKPCPLS